MKVNYELDLNTFKAWSGAVETLDRIQREGKCEEFENILDDLYPDGMEETELNDLLWFEPDAIFEWLGLRTEAQIENEIQEAKEELESLQDDYNSDKEDMTEEEAAELYEDDYKDDIEELQERIKELEEELEEL